MSDYPDFVPSRPLWLVTLADLALLLVGFFVLIQATQTLDRARLAQGLREGFGVDAPPAAMPVAAAGVTDFAPGSAVVPGGTADLLAWARQAVRDPRVTLTITGSADGSRDDVDPATGSAAVLAADRARAIAASLAAVAPRRITVTTSTAAHARAAIVTLAFAGEQKEEK